MAGVDILRVQYKGVAQAMLDVTAGNIDLTFSNPAASIAFVQSGRLRALAVTGADFKLSGGTSGEIVWRNDIPRKWDDKMYLYPIPESDLLTNPALKQNPGW